MPAYGPKKRLPAIDAMRGVVMILMTLDHASYAFNAGRYVTDSIVMYQPGSIIPATQFLLRWITHICAPTFIFLAGLSIALSIERKSSQKITDRQINSDLLLRGLFILALDPLWMSLGFGGRTVFQVLYAIGAGMVCMAFLRYANIRTLIVLGVLLMLGGEALAGLALWMGEGQRPGPVGALLFTGGRLGSIGFVLYPLFPWLAVMICGWVCGRLMAGGSIRNPAKWFAAAGAILLILFLIVRGLNGYGNMALLRDDRSVLQWLHVSKYPPSLSFTCLTLGLMGIIQSLLFILYGRIEAAEGDPLLVFGRTPLLFYILHVHLLAGAAVMLGMWQGAELTATFAAAVAVLIILYPLCRWYAGVKQSHPRSVLRYV